MSKTDLKPRAKELYTIHHMSLADISRAIDVSTRTLQNWKSDDHWDEARAAICGSEANLHSNLFELAEVMARKIKQDEIDGVKVSPERYTALKRVIDSADHSRKYEDKAPKNKKSEMTPEEKQQAALKKMQEALGLCQQNKA